MLQVLQLGALPPGAVKADEVAGAGHGVVDVDEQRRKRGHLDDVGVALDPCHEPCLRKRTLSAGNRHSGQLSKPMDLDEFHVGAQVRFYHAHLLIC